MKEFELKIEYLPVDSLTPYEKNTRKHSPTDIEGIKKSILDVGFDDPIGIWGKNNIIVEGHGRAIAAKELHLEKVPCIRLDHLTDAQRREYAIRHNRSAEMSAWDFDLLQEELAALDIDGIDMSDLNFTFDEMPPIPENLDGDDYDANAPMAVKFTFLSYEEYSEHEEEVKQFANKIGVTYSVVKG